MLPLKLSIEGVYSYQNKEVIDFENLTDAGLFGIFGAVGSGKSTILETIGFALYGNTERMNEREKRAYNMLNLKSNKAYIEFDFLNFNDEKYRFTATWSRGKKFDDVSAVDRKAYKWDGASWIPLESNDGAPIVGLSYDNFKRTIIIPQGKFKEFLELKGKDRSEMMKEIFQLERFDLGGKVQGLKSETQRSVDVLKGNLAAFELISQEAIQQKEEEIKTNNTILIESKKQLEVLTSEVQKLDQVKVIVDEIAFNEKSLKEFNEQEPAMDLLKSKLLEYSKIEKLFKHVLENIRVLENDLASTNEEKNTTNQLKQGFEKQLDELETKILVLQVKFNELPLKKEQANDFSALIELKENEIKLKEIDLELNVILKEFETLNEQEVALKANVDLLNEELLVCKKNRVDPAILIQLNNWYTSYDTLKLKKNNCVEKQAKTVEELSQYEKVFETLQLQRADWRVSLDQFKIENDKKIESEKESKTKLLISKELAHYSTNLGEGDACPVCGSLEHPSILQAEDVSAQLDLVNRAISELEKRNIELTEMNTQSLRAEENCIRLEKDLAILKTEEQDNSAEIEQHLRLFVWSDFQPEDKTFYTQKQAEFNEVEGKIKEKEEALAKRNIELQDFGKKKQEKQELKSTLELKLASCRGAKESKISQLKVLKWEDYETKSLYELQTEFSELSQANRLVEEQFTEATKLKSDLKEALSGKNGALTELVKRVDKLTKELQDKKQSVDQLLAEHSFESLAYVKSILDSAFNLEQETEKLEAYNSGVQKVKALLDDSIKRLEGRVFNAEDYTLKKNQAFELKSNYDNLFSNQAKREGELAHLNTEFLKKQNLLKEFEQLNKRLENLKTLENIFKGNGFVNYVSSIYLKNLAETANQRFHRITRNQLSLLINDKNEFEVVDYLNNGASRSVKTLSGGQSFQASLCLALALAESIQTQNSSDKNFFFIDEGFGTQDSESVSLVYDTLQSLMRENRIVGFISHLTELQERIPKSITIRKDDELGSYVEVN
jgi:DNA repair protein SbcC/Rad50